MNLSLSKKHSGKIVSCSIFLSIFIFFLGLCLPSVDGQRRLNYNTNLLPSSPTEAQFLKYLKVPISEYSGIANISVPIYEISVDEVKIPLDLLYFSGGIKVSQESSWVGLGWDLSIGSIVQTVNDKDDRGKDQYGVPFVKLLPDYFSAAGDGAPFKLPMIIDPRNNTPGFGWQNPFPISAVQPKQGYAIAINYGVPIEGDFSQKQLELFTYDNYDSEPDIFTVNILGEELNFTTNLKTNSIVILNKRGYFVATTSLGFKVINNRGTTFYFEEKSIIQNSTTTQNFEGGSSSGIFEPSSIIYFLTKIVTTRGKEINLQYTRTSIQDGYMYCDDKIQAIPHSNISLVCGPQETFTNTNDGSEGIFTFRAYSFNKENYCFLSSITFPNGSVDFELSNRNDITGSKKLDEITISNANGKTIKKWDFTYSYSDASNIGGNGYVYPNDILGNLTAEPRSSLRLVLSSLKETYAGKYQFYYSNVPLPKKNSFATDYWGYYNGKLTNFSFAPNPLTLGYADLGNNSNDKNANINYAEAGILEEIKYPTGGKVHFDYELNVFDPSQMIGLPQNMEVNGNGLRIKNIKHFSSDNTLSGLTEYNYFGGKLLNMQRIVRQLPYMKLDHFDMGIFQFCIRHYNLTEISNGGVFSSSPLLVDGVGYDYVIKKEIGSDGKFNGSTKTEFFNKINQANPTIETRTLYCGIPLVQPSDQPNNGTVKKQTFFDDVDNLIREVEYEYNFSLSPIYYGARILPNGLLNWYYDNQGSVEYHIIPQNLIGYYPIFGIETFLNKVTTKTYGNLQSLISENISSYDGFGQLSFEQTRSSDNGYEESYYSHFQQIPNYHSIPGLSALASKNRSNELVEVLKQKRPPSYIPAKNTFRLKKEFNVSGNQINVSKISISDNGDENDSRTIFFPWYDSHGNLLESIENGFSESNLWSYNSEYLTAHVKNAAQSAIAATSFEADGKGNWTFSGTPSATGGSITGKKSYSLSSGNITKSSLMYSKKYTISYWSKGSVTVSGGTQSNILTGKTINGWTYHQVEITGATNLTLTGSTYIDELRLYPADAQMTTYTYEPLIGMTSQCDANNKITYYEYDGLGRLTLARDEDNKILKRICYNFAGEVQDCNVSAKYVTIKYRNVYSTIADGYYQQYGDLYFELYNSNGEPLVLDAPLTIYFDGIQRYVDIDQVTILANQANPAIATITTGHSEVLFMGNLLMKSYPVDANGNQTGYSFETDAVITENGAYTIIPLQ